MWAGASNTGQNLFVLADGVRIPAHIFEFKPGPETGFILFRAPTLSSSVDNEFLLCWDSDVTNFVQQSDVDWTSLITNPGAETGDLTGWTMDIGLMIVTATSPHSGTWSFIADHLDTRYFQDIDVPVADESKVDSGDWVVRLEWFQEGDSNDYGAMGFTFLDSGSSPLDEEWKSSGMGFAAWNERNFSLIPPSGTRKVRIWMDSRGNVGGVYAKFDDITLRIRHVDTMKQWGVWQDYICATFIESVTAPNYGPGESGINIQVLASSPVYSALTMGAGGGVTVGAVGAYRGHLGVPLNTDEFSIGVTMIPSDVSTQQVAVGFTKRTSAAESPDESMWTYHDAAGDLRIQDDVNGVLSAALTLVNGTAYRVHSVHNGVSQRRVYADGIETEDLIIVVATNEFGTLLIAHEDQSKVWQWEGGLGYLWMRRDVISTAWAKAEHLALSDPGTFFGVSVPGNTEGIYIRFDGSGWSNVSVTEVRDDLQANAPYGELAVANEWTAEQTYDDGSALPAPFGTYTLQTTSPTTEDYPDGTLWVKTTSKIEMWIRAAGAWLRLLQDAAFRRITEDGSLRVTEAGDQRVMETVPVLLEVTPKYIKSLPGYSFSRTGGGTDSASYVDKNGIVQFTTDIRNGHYIGGVRHILGEGASENKCLRSSEFDNVAWTKGSDVTVTPNDAVAPDGTTSADKVDAVGANEFILQNVTVPDDSTSWTASVYLKKNASPADDMRLSLAYAGGGPNGQVEVDPATGTITSSTLDSERVESFDADWWRVSGTLANDSTGHVSLQAVFRPVADGAANPGFAHFWHGQVENLPFPTSPIVTAASAVTRNADSLSVGFPHLPQEMTGYMKGVELGTSLDSADLVFWHIGTTSTARLFSRARFGNGYRIRHISTAGDKFSTGSGLAALGDTLELRQTLNTDGSVQSAHSINGATEVVATASVANTLNATWSADTLRINTDTLGGALTGFFAFASLRFTQGINSIEDERAAAL